MPLTAENQITLYDAVPASGWKGKETRRYIFLDNGQDFQHPAHGLAYVYHVKRLDKGDPQKDWTLYIRPNSALAIGAAKQLDKNRNSLKGRTFDISKFVVGDDESEEGVIKGTRYELEEVFEE